MYYVTVKYESGDLRYREFEDINKAENLFIIMKLYNVMHDNKIYECLKIRKSLYSSKYGFFFERINNSHIDSILYEVKSFYKTNYLLEV